MGVGIRSMQKLLAAIPAGLLAVAKVADYTKKLQAKTNETALDRAKKGYESATSIKAQNKKIEKSYIDLLNSIMPGVKDSKTKPEKLLPQPKQNFILPEKGAEYPTIRADNSITGIDAKDEDVATLIKVREKNQNRVMGGLQAWETRKERVTSGNKNPFATFKELEKNLNRKYEDFSPVTWDEAKKLGLSKDTLINFVNLYENKEGDGVAAIFKQLKTKFKDDNAALSLIQDYEDNFYMGGDAAEAAANSNIELKDHLQQLTQKLLSGNYKEYDPEYAAQKQLEAAESQGQTYMEEKEVEENDKYSVWDDGEIVF